MSTCVFHFCLDLDGIDMKTESDGYNLRLECNAVLFDLLLNNIRNL